MIYAAVLSLSLTYQSLL